MTLRSRSDIDRQSGESINVGPLMIFSGGTGYIKAPDLVPGVRVAVTVETDLTEHPRRWLVEGTVIVREIQ